MASGLTAQGSMASGPTAPEETEKAASTLEALASALVESLPAVDLERSQSAKHQVAPAGLYRLAHSHGDGSDKHQLTFNPPNVVGNARTHGGLLSQQIAERLTKENAPRLLCSLRQRKERAGKQ
jgi:hypothetical protein